MFTNFIVIYLLKHIQTLCSEVNAGFFYKNAEEREKLVSAERDFIEKRVQKVIDLKKKLCDNTDKRFVVINQKVRCSIVYCSLDLQYGCEEAAGVLKYMHCFRVTYFLLCGMDITKCCFISCRKSTSTLPCSPVSWSIFIHHHYFHCRCC